MLGLTRTVSGERQGFSVLAVCAIQILRPAPGYQCGENEQVYTQRRPAYCPLSDTRTWHRFGRDTLQVAGTVAEPRYLYSCLSVLLCPFPCCSNSLCLVFLPCLRNVVGERIIWVRGAEQSLDREENSSDLEGRRPIA